MSINYKEISNNSGYKKVTRSFLNQLIDVIAEDVSSSVSRRKYQVFVTGGLGPGVTSSLFQTVYDQDFTLQTSNPIFDVTFGLAPPDVLTTGIANSAKLSKDNNDKYLYPSSSLMMREKTDVYGQFSQTLLGSRSKYFQLPPDATASASGTSTPIDAALFVSFKRLFSRDQIKRETFAMRFYQSASYVDKAFGSTNGDIPPASPSNGVSNLYTNSVSGSSIFTDIGSADAKYFDVGGQYGYLVNASDRTKAVGLVYYDSGIVVLDVSKAVSGSQFVSGTIKSVSATGETVIGKSGRSNFIPDFVVSGSMDNILDHFCYARFGTGGNTSMTFQNVTNINSSLIFCRAGADDFNFSTNPTYVNETTGELNIADNSLPADTQEPFTYITTIGLYDNNEGLLAVAKLSRPVEKNPGRDLTFRVRLDF
jgi:hypothetical protein